MNTIHINIKNNDLEFLFLSTLKLIIITAVLLFTFSCSNEDDCGYISDERIECETLELNIGDPCDTNNDGANDGVVNSFCECIQEDIPVVPEGCNLENEINMSTGIDANGDIITPALGVIDPYWRIINRPSLLSCSASTAVTFTGDAYVVNFSSLSGPDEWANQTGSSTLAPFDFGLGSVSGCSNPINNEGESIPYVFERSFCVKEDTTVDFSFTYKADNEIYFDLINNTTNLPVVPSSTTYVYAGSAMTFSASAVALSVGSYSIRGYLVNGNSVLGMSLVGNMTTTNGDFALSNNELGCCENNVISVLNIFEVNCDGIFDNNVDAFAVGLPLELYDSNNNLISTQMSDANGNVFFAGLPDGTYNITIPSGTDIPNAVTTVTVSGNVVEIVELYECPIE